ncbi:hypothetical protein ACFPRL_23655 [Pseudoclavibacter helvolus]
MRSCIPPRRSAWGIFSTSGCRRTDAVLEARTLSSGPLRPQSRGVSGSRSSSMSSSSTTPRSASRIVVLSTTTTRSSVSTTRRRICLAL